MNILNTDQMSKNKDFIPDFIGIGAMKSATSWIFSSICSHPKVCSNLNKELHFFDREKNYKKGIGCYKNLFSKCKKNKIKGEFTPRYLYKPKCAKRINKHFPNTKIIVCLRDPVKRAYSHYKYSLAVKGRMSIYKNFSEAIKKDTEMVERGFYYKQLKRYYDKFPENKILVTFFKNLKNNPESFIKKVYSFLNIDPNFVPKEIHKKENTSKEKSYEYKIPIVNNTLYRIRNKLQSSYIEELCEKTGMKTVLKKIVKMNKTNVNKKNNVPPLLKEDKEKMYKIYKEDIKKLEKLLDTKLSHWIYETN